MQNPVKKSFRNHPAPLRVAVIGGGAAGFFGAIACAADRADADVHIYEKAAVCLAKVAVAGGGRCNATHACFNPRELAAHYPRGARELLGAFHRFQPEDTVRWFAGHGVRLIAEPDGCMFPDTNQSATIVNCLLETAAAAGVSLHTGCGVTALRRRPAGGFILSCAAAPDENYDAVLLATGGNPQAGGYALAAGLGHAIADPVPSLFAVQIPDAALTALAGIVVPDAAVAALKIRQTGPLLITHEGLSGPAILKLSAWGARALHDADYRAELRVNWTPEFSIEQLQSELRRCRAAHGRGRVANQPLASLQKRLWLYLLGRAGIPVNRIWAELTRAEADNLIQALNACGLMISGRSLNKAEFVTCGGVRLSEVDFRSMQSRICPGLYLAGEVLDIDGLTGGFNLQAAWTTGWLAGQALRQ